MFSLFIFDCSIKEGIESRKQCTYDPSSDASKLEEHGEQEQNDAENEEDRGPDAADRAGNFAAA